jgi:hypothetical protein
MSMVNQTPTRGQTPRFRVVIATAVATLLLGSSFYSAQAGNNGGYNDHLSGLEIAAIATGAVGGGLIIASMMRDKNDDDDEASAAKEKSAKAVTGVRVRSSQNRLTAGDTTTVAVEAQFAGSEAWQNVTDKASVRLVKGNLTQIDGSKNAFALPFGSRVAPGEATIEASFAGQSALTTVAVN